MLACLPAYVVVKGWNGVVAIICLDVVWTTDNFHTLTALFMIQQGGWADKERLPQESGHVTVPSRPHQHTTFAFILALGQVGGWLKRRVSVEESRAPKGTE